MVDTIFSILYLESHRVRANLHKTLPRFVETAMTHHNQHQLTDKLEQASRKAIVKRESLRFSRDEEALNMKILLYELGRPKRPQP